MRKLLEFVTFSQDGSFWTTILDLHKKVLKSDFVQKVSETFAVRLLIMGIGIITSAAVARALGPEGKGLYSAAILISSLGTQFGNLGLHASNIYFVAGNRKLIPAAIGNSLGVGLGLGGLIGVLGWMFLNLFPSLAPIEGLLLTVALLSVPAGLVYLLLVNVLLGIQAVRFYNQVEIFIKLLTVFLIFFLVWLNSVSVENLILINIIVLAFGSAFVLWKLNANTAVRPRLSLSFFRDSVHYGWKSYLAALFSFLVLRIDQIMVKFILGAEALGYYSTAVNMIDMMYMLPVVVGTLLFPKLSAMSSDLEKWNFTKKVSLVVFGVMVLSCLPAVLACKPLVILVYGQNFVGAVPAFLWLLPAVVLISTNAVFMNYFASIGNPMITVYSPAAAALVNVLLNLKLIPWLGIIGASVSSIIAYGIMMGFSLFYIGGRKKWLPAPKNG